ncbi:MAG: quinone-dependent dihydroorotate dehydrogenase [Alphaproteobacteria bacterium]|nr:quinone-dependent dihydroorotate dehydrogenase [Alphaproteobacteria bacterium]
MVDLYALARPLLFRIDPERAHALTIRAMRQGVFPKCAVLTNSALAQTLWGLKFPNPVGLAAGFDKNAEVLAAAFGLGFGFVEAGTVTPRPQPGNDKPRVFRDPGTQAIINRMGFPGTGATVFKANLEKFLAGKRRPPGVVGINIGMNKGQSEPSKDYAYLIRMLAPMADYLTINISSPNTPGLRDLQARAPLLELLSVITEERRKACGAHPPALFLKLAPDLDAEKQEELAACALESGIDGLILGNTTLDRPETLPESFRAEKGGLSGQPLTEKSTQIIHNFYALTKGKIPIIGVGGVSSGAQAYAKIKAGASLVQLYTALVFKGPSVANSINEELVALLKEDGFDHISQAIGKAHGA